MSTHTLNSSARLMGAQVIVDVILRGCVCLWSMIGLIRDTFVTSPDAADMCSCWPLIGHTPPCRPLIGWWRTLLAAAFWLLQKLTLTDTMVMRREVRRWRGDDDTWQVVTSLVTCYTGWSMSRRHKHLTCFPVIVIDIKILKFGYGWLTVKGVFFTEGIFEPWIVYNNCS